MTKKKNDILEWMSPSDRREYKFLMKKKTIVDRAIDDGTLELRIEDARKKKDAFGKWGARIVDNLGGDSFLYIPNLEFVQDFFYGSCVVEENDKAYSTGEDGQGDNRIVKAWYRESSGYSAGDGMDTDGTPGEIVLMQPRSYIYRDQGYVEVFVSSSKELKDFTCRLKEYLSYGWDGPDQERPYAEGGYSFLENRLEFIRSDASSKRHEHKLEMSRKREYSKGKRAIKNMVGKKF